MAEESKLADTATPKYWRRAIEIGNNARKERVKNSNRLLQRYDLDYKDAIKGLDRVIRISRFYPTVRAIIASTSFHYPRVFLRVENDDAELSSTLLEKVANDCIQLMGVKEHVQQAIFDALFYGVGWLKIGYNPTGDDSIAPYVSNDSMRDDFPYVRRIPAQNIITDSITPPHILGEGRYIIEEQWLPWEFLRKDERYKNRRQIKPTSISDDDADMLRIKIPGEEGDEELQSFKDSIEHGQMVRVWEIHDRLHRKLYAMADGVDGFIRDEPHPFLRQEAVTIPDPITGEPLMTGEFEDGQGYLVPEGFQYIPIKFDASGDGYWPTPPIEYIEDLQNVMVESVSRRADLLKRFPRLTVLSPNEAKKEPLIAEKLKKSSDGDLIIADPNNIRELQWGRMPDGQLELENDARIYEEQITLVNELVQGASPRRTATESALIASAGSVNREWMQSVIGGAYKKIITGCLNIMGDQRYTPDNFAVNMAREGHSAVMQIVQQSDFLLNFIISVQAGSMQPLIESLDREQFVELYSMLQGNPMVDQEELLKTLISSYRISDVDKLISSEVDAEATRAAELENEGWMINGQDPGVDPGQDHQTHLETHGAFFQQLNQELQLLAAQFASPESQARQQQLQGAVQAAQAHIDAHIQNQEQQGGMTGGGGEPPARQPTPEGITGQVRASAQETASAVERSPEDFD